MWKIDSGSLSGSTTGAYAPALGWNTAELGNKTILLKNSNGGASLKYRLLGYAAKDGLGKELTAEATLAAGETAEFHLTHQWERLELLVMNGSGVSTYQVDYEGQGA